MYALCLEMKLAQHCGRQHTARARDQHQCDHPAPDLLRFVNRASQCAVTRSVSEDGGYIESSKRMSRNRRRLSPAGGTGTGATDISAGAGRQMDRTRFDAAASHDSDRADRARRQRSGTRTAAGYRLARCVVPRTRQPECRSRDRLTDTRRTPHAGLSWIFALDTGIGCRADEASAVPQVAHLLLQV